MTLREALLTLHILTAILVIGWLSMQWMLLPRLLRQGPAAAGVLRFVHERSRLLGRIAPVVFLLGLALGITGEDHGIRMSDPWLSASMGLFVVASVIGAVLVGGAERAALLRFESGQPAEGEAKRIAMYGGINALILLVIVYLMVAKPGA